MFYTSVWVIFSRSPRPTALPSCGQHRRGLIGIVMEGTSVGRRFRHHQLSGRKEGTPHVQLDKSWKHQVGALFMFSFIAERWETSVQSA